MASMNYVADLRPFKMMENIRVKVIQLWKRYSATAGENIYDPDVRSLCNKWSFDIKKLQKKRIIPTVQYTYSIINKKDIIVFWPKKLIWSNI